MRDAGRMKKMSQKLLPLRIAEELREEILTREDGEYIGSENELVARFKVSHPTFRQTARLLEQEQLLTVRRGPGGGYYAKLPLVADVARTAGTYLRTRKVGLHQVFRAMRDAVRVVGRAAALADDPENFLEIERLRRKLVQLSKKESLEDEDVEHVLMQLQSCIITIADDPVSELIISMLHHVADEELRRLMPRDQRGVRAKYVELSAFLADAVLAREPDLASTAFERLVEYTIQLMSLSESPIKA